MTRWLDVVFTLRDCRTLQSRAPIHRLREIELKVEGPELSADLKEEVGNKAHLVLFEGFLIFDLTKGPSRMFVLIVFGSFL